LMASLALAAAVVLDADPCSPSRVTMTASLWPAHLRGSAAGTTPSTAQKGAGSYASTSSRRMAMSLADAGAPIRPARASPPVHVARSHDMSPATSRQVAPAKPGSVGRDAAPCSSAR
jgi:hypothetical protein